MLHTKRYFIFFTILTLAIGILFSFNLILGSVKIPFSEVMSILFSSEAQKNAWELIVLNIRLPQAIVALLTGAGISVSGLLLQTAFRNPLADSGVLGISAGASLGVALVVLFFGGSVGGAIGLNLSSAMTILLGAFVGASLVLVVIMFFSTIIKNNLMLLIIGIMVGYLTSSIISLLNYWGTSDKVFSFVMWGMGSFAGLSMQQVSFYTINIVAGVILAIILIKPLNALLLGDRYATNLGVNIKRVRILLLLCAGWLTAITTAYCGPISFIGLAVPHIARLLLGTSNHKLLLPGVIWVGSTLALLCNLISTLPMAGGLLPLNAITPLFGAPVIIYVIINQKKIQYFN